MMPVTTTSVFRLLARLAPLGALAALLAVMAGMGLTATDVQAQVPASATDYSPTNVTVRPYNDTFKVYWDANATNPATFYVITWVKESDSHFANSSFVGRRNGSCRFHHSGNYQTKEHGTFSNNHSSISSSSGFDFERTIPFCGSSTTGKDKVQPGINFKVKVIGRDGDGSNASHFEDFVEVTGIRTGDSNRKLNLNRVIIGDRTMDASWGGSPYQAEHIVFAFKSGSAAYPSIPDSVSVGDSANTTDSSGNITAGYRILAADATSAFVDGLVPRTAYTAKVQAGRANFIYPATERVGRAIGITPSENGRRMKIHWNAIDSSNIPDKFVVHYGSWGFYYGLSDFKREAASNGDGLEQGNGHRKGFKFLTPADVTSSSAYDYEAWIPYGNTSGQLAGNRLYNHIFVCEVNGDGTADSHYACDDSVGSNHSLPDGVWSKPHGVTLTATQFPENQIKTTWPAPSSDTLRNVVLVYKSGTHPYPTVPASLSPVSGDTIVGGKKVAGYRVLAGDSTGYQLAETDLDGAATYTVKLIPRAVSNQVINLPDSDEVEIDLSESFGDTTTEFVTNLAQGNHETNDTVLGLSQKFTTGASSNGYILTSVKIVSVDAEGDDFKAEIWSIVTNGHPTVRLFTLTSPTSFAAGTLTFTAPENTRLSPSTTYGLVVSSVGGESVAYARTTSAAEDSSSASDWNIENTYEWRDSGGNWRNDPTTRALRIAVRGVVNSQTAPGAPTGLTATATSQSRIELSWTAPDDDGGSAIESYQIQFSSNGGTTWSDLASTDDLVTTAANTGLVPNTTRHYRVAARNVVGVGAYSNTAVETANVLVGNAGQSHNSIGDVTVALAQNFETGSHSAGYTLAGVDVVSVDGEGDDFGVAVWTVDTSENPEDKVADLTGPVSFAAGRLRFTAPDDITLSANTTYAVVSTAIGTGSVGYSETTSANEDAGAAADFSIWNNFRYSQGGDNWGQNLGKSMRIAVRGVTAAATLPGAPTGLTAAARGPNRIDLSWTAPENDGGEPDLAYKVEVSSDGNTWTDLVANTSRSDTRYSHTGLTVNSTWHYRVSAINIVGTGPASNTATDTTNVFVRNLAQGNLETDNTLRPLSQRFTTGGHSSGYILTSVEVVSDDTEGDDFTAEIWTVDSSTGHPSGRHAALTAPDSFAAGTLTFTAPAATRLAARTTYALVVSGDGTNRVQHARTTSVAEDSGGASGWSIQNTYEWKDTSWHDDTTARALRMALRGETAEAVAPAAPAALTASATGPTRIDLSWGAPDSGGATISGYKIEVSTDGNAWTDLVANTNMAATTYSHTTLTAGSTRHYRVTAINRVGTSPVSNTATDTTNVFVRNTGQSNQTSFGSTNNQSQPFTTGSNNGGYTLTGIEVVSADSEGDTFTASVWIVDNGVPSSKLADLTAPGSFAAGTLTFTAPDDTTLAKDTTYAVVVSPVGSGNVTYGATSSTGEDAGFASGWSIANYQQWQDSFGNWANSTGRSIRIVVRGTPVALSVTKPDPPTGLVAGWISPSRFDLSWTAPVITGNSEITGYKIEVSRNRHTWTDLVADTGNANTIYSHTGITSRRNLYYRVTAMNSAESSEPSNTTHDIKPEFDSSNFLVSNAEQSHTSTVDAGVALAQNFTTGPLDGGYTLAGVDVVSMDAESDDFAVAIWTTSSGRPHTKVADMMAPISRSPGWLGSFDRPGRLIFAAPANITLSASTTYAVVATLIEGGNVTYAETSSANEDSGAAAGFSIANAYANQKSDSSWEDNTGKALRIAVRGEAVNPPPSNDGGGGGGTPSPPAYLSPQELNVGQPAAYWLHANRSGSGNTLYGCSAETDFKILWNNPVRGGSVDEWEVRVIERRGLSVKEYDLYTTSWAPGMDGTMNVSGEGSVSLLVRGRYGETWGTWSRVALLRCDPNRLTGRFTPSSAQESPGNTEAAGAPTISGTAQVGETLTADTSGISDADGMAKARFEYRWLVDDVEVGWDSGSSYVPTNEDIGKTIRVAAAFTDDAGSLESRTSAATAAVEARPNTPATGAPTTSGTAHVGEALTATTAGIADADGLTNVSYAYQWVRNDGTRDSDISGATASAYTPVAADQGKTLRVRVSFTDDAGNAESLTSAATAAVGAARPALTARALAIHASHDGNAPFTFELHFSVNPSVRATNLRDRAFRVTEGEVVRVRRLSSGRDLRWEITVQPDGNEDVTVVLPVPTDCASRGAICTGDDQKLSNELTVTVPGPSSYTPATNTPATGVPAISGTARVGETLTASTTGIADSDGLTNVSHTYQWVRNDGTDDADISGATGSAYTLVADDRGKTIKVRVSFTDDADNAESRTSAATAAVEARPNTPATGAPAISGTAQVGETLTASTTGIADEDGLTNVSHTYQWVRNDGTDDADISGATGSSYTLVADDRGKTIKVRVSFTDDAGNAESRTSAATAAVEARPNTPATGAPAISGTAQVGETLTASTTGIADEDGLTNVSHTYQWVRNDGTGDSDISGATGSAYTLVADDRGKTIKVRVSFTDDAGNAETLTSAATAAVEARPNTPATGAPAISGTARVGETLTASTTGIADSDGLTNVSHAYQWVRNDGTDDSDIGGATGGAYTLVADDRGKTIKVRVSFTDDAGNAESRTSAATAAVEARPNTPATGAPAISGTARVGETLTASTTGIADSDGLTNVSHTYQWVRNDGTDDADISGATGSSYTLVADDRGKTIKVRVSFTDDAGNAESRTSAATAAVEARPNTPATGAPAISGTAQVGETLTASTTGIADEDGLTNVSHTHQWVRNDGTGDSDISGATGSSYTLVADDRGKTIKVRVSFTDDAGNAESRTSAATAAVEARPNTPATGAPAISGTARVGETLTASTTGIADSDGLTNVSHTYQWVRNDGTDDSDIGGATASAYTLVADDRGKTIKVRVSFTDDAGNAESRTSAATAAVEARPNTPATGAPAISGTARVSETLTASTTGIADSDGLTNVSHTYQWVRNDGTDDADISGATGSSYTLVADDRGKTIKVRVSFTDDAGNTETLTSAATAEIDFAASQQNAANTPATGVPAISGTAQVGETLTASTTGIADSDGLTNVSHTYQWVRNDGTDDADISGATGSSYTLVADDRGKTIKVRVSFTDDAGNAEMLTSAATAEIEPRPNTPARGLTSIRGTARVGETLTAITMDVSDADGMTDASYGYQWLADDSDISGATGINYTLTASEQGNAIRVRVFFTDDAGNTESLTSPATGPVAEAWVLTASAHYMPASHDGSSTFEFQLRFSEEPRSDFSYKTLRDHAFNVTGGEVIKARRLLRPGNTRWGITVRPDGNGDVTVVLPVTTDCADQGAICTGDGRKLSNELTITVAGPPTNDPPANTPATGAPAISGTARVGETLTASTTGIADTDGLTNVAHAYQWVRNDGTGDSNIGGATASAYTLVAADRGKTVKVRVSFTDDAGNAETLTSAATAAVEARPNTPATGAPAIRGTAQVGETLNASVTGIADSDGLTNATFTYRWLADDTEVSGATGSSYALVSGDQGKAIKVRVSFTDDAGNAESLTSAATASVAAPLPALTASIHSAPSSHNGSDTFTFELRFSEEPKDGFSYKTLRDHAFTVTGGEVVSARRLERGQNIRWEITVRPDGNGAVTIVLPPTTDCEADGAVCTDDGRMLSGRLEITVPGP